MKERLVELFGGCDVSLLESFKKFHKENPKIYELFEKFSDDAKRAGRKRFSHWMIINRIRWYTSVETTGVEFKISNDFITMYARLLTLRRPEFDGFFSLKKLKPSRKWKTII